ncbi:MAG: hypothetical protein HUU28_13295 [Planctomycetaceae bacterium]|nr:hypothetical protein [Planctomycetaceae bacterium]
MHEDRDEGQSYSDANLESAEYRERLKRKLNCLIAVLEVATAKVKQSLAGPAPDLERLTKIQKNLQDTLEVCLRARAALERRGGLPEDVSRDLAAAVNPDVLGFPTAPAESVVRREYRAAAAKSDEKARFRELPKIDKQMIGSVDLDELSRKLQG